ncbi:MAG: hypothetical protein ACTH29_08545 [Fusobacterium sp.]
MKKLTLLLAAVTIASAAYAKEVMPVAEVAAAPMLTVTSIGQSIEIDNDSGASNGNVGRVMLGNSVNFAYGDDWTFGLFARKEWDTDTDDGFGDTGSRINLDAWKSYENTKLGFRFRMADSYDRYYIRGKYSYGMYSGWADLAYTSVESEESKTGADYFYLEATPVKIDLGPVAIGYYIEAKDMVGSIADGDTKDWARHQVRLYVPLYSTEKFNLSGQYRYQFAEHESLKNDSWDDENNLHTVMLSADYAINDNLTIDGYYQYDFNKYEESDDDFYGEFCIGWTYKF